MARHIGRQSGDVPGWICECEVREEVRLEKRTYGLSVVDGIGG